MFVSLLLFVESHFFVIFVLNIILTAKHVMFLWVLMSLHAGLFEEGDFATSALELIPLSALKLVRIKLTEAIKCIAIHDEDIVR